MDQGRLAFDTLSQKLTQGVRVFGVVSEESVYLVHCPMAFDFRGADWLQSSSEIRNPYFGSEMLECGSVKETLAAAEGKSHEH
jgi:Cu(I)/Ag(I) efflux system membrane fusion protein